MEIAIRQKLIELARQGETWSYSQLNDQMDLRYDFRNPVHRKEIGDLIGKVSEIEFEKGRPLLSALILHQGGREQGDGFYKLCAAKLGVHWETLKKDRSWEKSVIEDCFNFWQDNANFWKYKDDY
jgi:hypothetical protein